MVYLSDRAKEKLVSIMKEEGLSPETSFVRFGVLSGGCSGLSYDLSFEQEQSENDKVFKNGEVKVIINKNHFLYLAGTTLEYSGGLNGKGFYFNNPNAKRTCGCGDSFSS